jgi:hypothetical protein
MGGRGLHGDDDFHAAANELRCQLRKARFLAMGGPDLDMEIPSFDVAVLTECFAKRSQWLWAGDKKESDLPYPLRLLRPRRERPRRRAAEQRDELAASQFELHAIFTAPATAYPMGAGASSGPAGRTA